MIIIYSSLTNLNGILQIKYKLWINTKNQSQKLRLEFGEGLNREVEFLIRNPRVELSIGMKDLTVKYWYLRKQ